MSVSVGVSSQFTRPAPHQTFLSFMDICVHKMLGLWLWLAAIVSEISTSPCCNNTVMVRENDMMLCKSGDGDTLIAIYKWCDSFFMITPSENHENEHFTFIENEEKTQYSMDKNKWLDSYCTGILINATDEESDKIIPEKDVAMICFVEREQEEDDHYSIYATCLLISCVFLFATLSIYIWLPELLDLQGKCVLCFIFSLMIGYICLIYLQLPITSPEITKKPCVFIAFLTYFWMMSAFFWLNINSFNMWRSAVLAHIKVSERKLINAYYAAGWGMPLLFLVVALTTHNLPGDHIIRPNFGVQSCWFKGKLELWSYFYGPVLFLLICNIAYFTSTAFYLWSDYRNPSPMPRIKTLRIKFYLYFKLFLVMGITWIFEILSSMDEEPWYVTDILNCFQGVIIFVVMIILRKRVWRAIAAKRLCGMQFANCWQKMEDEETVDENLDDQQLSTNHSYKP